MSDKRYPFFANTECDKFPCHPGIEPEEFNCAFCYCPLYLLGPNCGGNFKYLESGVKSCVDCAKPHRGTDGIDLVKEHWALIQKASVRK